MRYLLISNVYANLPAFEAVLADAKGFYDQVWCLGDLVSIGSYPNECVELLMTLNHLCVAGNDDWIVLGKGDFDTSYLDDLGQSNPEMRSSFLETRELLTNKVRIYLDELPTSILEDQFTLTHGSPRHPLWESLHSSQAAQANFKHLKTKYCCVGNYQAPLVFEEVTGLNTVRCLSASNPDANKSDGVIELTSQRLIINCGAVGGGVVHQLNFVYSFYSLLDTQTNILEFRHVPLKTNPFVELRKKTHSTKSGSSLKAGNSTSIEMSSFKHQEFRQDTTENRQISGTRPPEIVLEEFITELRSYIKTIEVLLPDLGNVTTHSDSKAIFSELYTSLLFVNQYIASVIDYLNLRIKGSVCKSENMAEAILAEFTHTLRELALPMMGFVAVCQKPELSEEKLRNDLSTIDRTGKLLIQGFHYLEVNWRIWLETKNFNRRRFLF